MLVCVECGDVIIGDPHIERVDDRAYEARGRPTAAAIRARLSGLREAGRVLLREALDELEALTA